MRRLVGRQGVGGVSLRRCERACACACASRYRVSFFTTHTGGSISTAAMHFQCSPDLVNGVHMRAAVVRDGKGNAEALHVVDDFPVAPLVDQVRATPGTALIKVHAAGVNRPDIMQRAGLYPPPKGASPILGLEVSGEIVAVHNFNSNENSNEMEMEMEMEMEEENDPFVRGLGLGSKVCALTNGGGYADYCFVQLNQCLPIPDTVSLTDAAGLPETYFTVWHNIFQRGRLQDGETLLVHGGSSGIGCTAIQLAKHVRNDVTVAVTAGSDMKCSACVDLGADVAVNYKAPDDSWDQALRAQLNGGVDLILDMVAGDYTPQNVKLLNMDGRVVIIGLMRGPKSEVSLAHVMTRRLSITGSTLRPQSARAKMTIGRELRKHVWPLWNTDKLKTTTDEVYALSDAAAAHRHLESSTNNVGKIILDCECGR